MSQAMATFVMMNNYFHDVATATILALAVVLWIVVSHLQKNRSQAGILMVRYLRKTLLFCLAWLVTGGIVRIVAFSKYELPEAAFKGLTQALFLKHIVAFLIVLGGGILWQKGAKIYRNIAGKQVQDENQ